MVPRGIYVFNCFFNLQICSHLQKASKNFQCKQILELQYKMLGFDLQNLPTNANYHVLQVETDFYGQTCKSTGQVLNTFWQRKMMSMQLPCKLPLLSYWIWASVRAGKICMSKTMKRDLNYPWWLLIYRNSCCTCWSGKYHIALFGDNVNCCFPR